MNWPSFVIGFFAGIAALIGMIAFLMWLGSEAHKQQHRENEE